VTANDPNPGERRTDPATEPDGRPLYEIRVMGHVGASWTAWFDGLDITNEADGSSLIRGRVVDQAALHGLLNKVRDIGLTLESLTQPGPDGATRRRLADLEPTNNDPSGELS
jgi:hypothetical protein